MEQRKVQKLASASDPTDAAFAPTADADPSLLEGEQQPRPRVTFASGLDESAEAEKEDVAGASEEEDDAEDDDVDVSVVVPERVAKKDGAAPNSNAASNAASAAATREVSRVASGTNLLDLGQPDFTPPLPAEHERLQQAAPALSVASAVAGRSVAPDTVNAGLSWCTLRPVHFDMQGQISPVNSKGEFRNKGGGASFHGPWYERRVRLAFIAKRGKRSAQSEERRASAADGLIAVSFL